MSDDAPAAEEPKPEEPKTEANKAAPAPPTPKKEGEASVIIIPRPKVIFLWPFFAAAVIAGIWTTVDPEATAPGRLFCWTFFLNMLALAFDFTRGSFVALILGFAVVAMGIILLDREIGVIEPLRDFFSFFDLKATPHTYFAFVGAMIVVFFGVWIEGHFDYWEITHNEVLHHKGFLGDVKRYSAPSLHLEKELPDLFEYCLYFPFGGAGRIILQPHGHPRAFVLNNVVGVTHIEEKIKELLSKLQVKIDTTP